MSGTNSTVTLWFPKHLRNDPHAEEFADFLDKHCVWGADQFNDSGWDAEIPPRDEWIKAVAEFNEHLESLGVNMDPIIPEPDGLTYPEAKALIEAAQRVVSLCDNYLTIYDGRPKLRDAIGHLRLTLRHITPADDRRTSW